MTHRYRISDKNEPILPGDEVPPSAENIRITDCGDPDCQHIHILLLDPDGNGIAQATINLRMLAAMVDLFDRKGLLR